MAEDSDDEIAKEARRRVSRHRGPGASSVAPKVEKLLGLRPSSEAQLELLQGEDAALRELEALRCVFCRSYHGRGAWDEPEGAEAEGEGGELCDDCASESSERSPWAGDAGSVEPTWRLRERMKTVSVALVLCLNIGTDPPDAVAASPRARRVLARALRRAEPPEGFGDHRRGAPGPVRALAEPRALPAALDPAAASPAALRWRLGRSAATACSCTSTATACRGPANGEVWVFNKNYTQYIPSPSTSSVRRPRPVYVLDCGGAGVLLPHFTAPMPRHHDRPPGDKAPTTRWAATSASCSRRRRWTALPSDPGLPDLFTACLTTPIAVALRAFGAGAAGRPPGGGDAADVPGRLGDRKTPLGELNWIFTAVTDTIAWNVLPAPLFQRLFRQDLLLASLFRNFLLAERVLKAHGCTPATVPPLPPTADHPLWAAWDLAAEGCLAQLAVGAGRRPRRRRRRRRGRRRRPRATARRRDAAAAAAARARGASGGAGRRADALEVWLAGRGAQRRCDAPRPEQLPVVLQVLLSQAHRVRALVLLRRFLELGPRRELGPLRRHLPYVLAAPVARAGAAKTLVAIWAAILAFDASCRGDLVRDGAHLYFVSHLAALEGAEVGDAAAERELDEQRALAAFVLANVCAGDRDAADACLAKRLDAILRDRLRRGAASDALPGDRGGEAPRSCGAGSASAPRRSATGRRGRGAPRAGRRPAAAGDDVDAADDDEGATTAPRTAAPAATPRRRRCSADGAARGDADSRADAGRARATRRPSCAARRPSPPRPSPPRTRATRRASATRRGSAAAAPAPRRAARAAPRPPSWASRRRRAAPATRAARRQRRGLRRGLGLPRRARRGRARRDRGVAAPPDAAAPPVDDDDADRVGESFGDEAGARLSGDDRGAAPRARGAPPLSGAARRWPSGASPPSGAARPSPRASGRRGAGRRRRGARGRGRRGGAAAPPGAAASAAAPAETLEDLLSTTLALAGELRLYRRHRNRYRCREARRGRVAAPAAAAPLARWRSGAALPGPRPGPALRRARDPGERRRGDDVPAPVPRLSPRSPSPTRATA
ncbi:hypothetical protein JL721_12642 [Aureococcus anophagefferens]|nr:hypothetical protein JL721_12642 [Aureococcus anophagefferens]